MDIRPITPEVAISAQPGEDDLTDLRQQGYTGVVNLRNDGEPEQPLGTAAEGEKVRALGMDYLHYGVGSAPLTDEGVGAVRDFLARHEGQKVLVHCRKGGRAAALLLIDRALAEGWPVEEAFARGEAMGLKVEGQGLRNLVEDYLRRKATGG